MHLHKFLGLPKIFFLEFLPTYCAPLPPKVVWNLSRVMRHQFSIYLYFSRNLTLSVLPIYLMVVAWKWNESQMKVTFVSDSLLIKGELSDIGNEASISIQNTVESWKENHLVLNGLSGKTKAPFFYKSHFWKHT